MISATRKVIASMADDILSLAHLVMSENSLAESSLNDDIQCIVEGSDNVIIKLLFNQYIEYIEKGRPAHSGATPPISELRDWAMRKGIPANNNTLYAIAQAIQQQAMAPRPILCLLEQKIDESFAHRWADNLLEAITEELNRFFP